MKTQIEQIKTKLHERKSWLKQLVKINESALNHLSLLSGIDDPHILKKIEYSEKEYQELLFLLRGVQMTAIEINVKPFDASMYNELNKTQN